MRREIDCDPYELPSGKLIPVKFTYDLEWNYPVKQVKTMASTFDPNVFLNQEIKGANEVKYTPVPIGEYQCYIDDLGTDTYEDQPILIITYALISEELKKTLGLEKPTVQDRIFLDVDETGALAFGPNKNVRLGRVREACGQNAAGKKWNMNMLRGAGPLMIMVDHRFNKTTGEGPFSNVTRVTKGS